MRKVVVEYRERQMPCKKSYHKGEYLPPAHNVFGMLHGTGASPRYGTLGKMIGISRKERNMKYYKYSVKDVLTQHFPKDTVRQMRAIEDHWHDSQECGDMLPLAWAYADETARGYFLSELFLEDTLLFDDYIAYIVRRGEKQMVYLAFLHDKDHVPFDLDPAYAYALREEWQQKGYEIVIMRICVEKDESPGGRFRFVTHLIKELGVGFLIPEKVGDRYVFLWEQAPFWRHAEALFLEAVKSGSLEKYECLFDENICVSKRKSCISYEDPYKVENQEIFVQGLDQVKRYLKRVPLPRMVYVKNKESAAFDTRLLFGDTYYFTMYVSRRNLISRLLLEEIQEGDEILPVPASQMPEAVKMPAVRSVRALGCEALHAFAIQTIFSDGCVKNYYLKAVTDRKLPAFIEIDGYRIDEEVLHSVRYICDGEKNGALFSNGYYIPAHLLYYRGYTQMIPEITEDGLYEDEEIKMLSRYRIPLITGNVLDRTRIPRKDAYYGVNAAMLNERGERISALSVVGLYGDEEKKIFKVCREPDYAVGYLRADGSWLVPPIFDKGDDFEYRSCVNAERDGKKFLINRKGDVFAIEYEIDASNFDEGLCPFKESAYDGEVTYPEDDLFEDLSPGVWGYIDESGKVAISAQYVFATNFYLDGGYAFVAKIADGKTLWGMIDTTGRETIPCQYVNLTTYDGHMLYFQREQGEDYGLMDFNENVLLEPRFSFIKDYDQERHMVAAGYDWGKCGVYDIAHNRVIVPFEYESVYFDDETIECEKTTGGEDLYDYDGNLIKDPTMAHKWKREGGFGIWKNGKCGMIDANGNEILPCIFDASSHMDYFLKGFVITGEKGAYGVSDTSGKIILPQKYDDIVLKDDFIIAVTKKDSGWHLSDELYNLKGDRIFRDISRRICVEKGFITRETPLGEEKIIFCRKQKALNGI